LVKKYFGDENHDISEGGKTLELLKMLGGDESDIHIKPELTLFERDEYRNESSSIIFNNNKSPLLSTSPTFNNLTIKEEKQIGEGKGKEVEQVIGTGKSSTFKFNKPLIFEEDIAKETTLKSIYIFFLILRRKKIILVEKIKQPMQQIQPKLKITTPGRKFLDKNVEISFVDNINKEEVFLIKILIFLNLGQ
jgi:hypothetical protein